MVRMKNGELQIQSESMDGRIYVRMLKQKGCVDVVATSDHALPVSDILGQPSAEDAKEYPLWPNISAYDLARLIELGVNAE